MQQLFDTTDNLESLYKFEIKDALDFLKTIDNNSVDLVLTDPPYFINEEMSLIRRSNKIKFKGNHIDFKKDTEWDRVWKNKDEFRKWLYKIIDHFYRILKDNKHLVMFCNKRDINYIQDYGESLGFKVRQFFVIRKSNPVPRARKISPMTTVEIAVWLTKGKAKVEEFNRELGMFKDVIDVAIPRKQGNIERHPTQNHYFLWNFL